MLSQVFWLANWFMLGVSIFNAVMIFWLGLTIFLNAERRTFGVYVVTFGLLMGTLFFISHTIILGTEIAYFGTQPVDFWWLLGWVPVILIPFLWYTVILWYTGYWEHDLNTRLYLRHRFFFAMIRVGVVVILGLLIFAHPLPSWEQLAQLDLSDSTQFLGVPILFLLYPPFAGSAFLLSIDALKHPEPSQRMMGDLARQRSRPWLIGASVTFVFIAICVIIFIGWLVMNAALGSRDGAYGYQRTETGDLMITTNAVIISTVVVFDLFISTLIAASVVLLGQAVVSYEVFTGKTLPRHGFARHFRNTLWLAAGVSMIASWSFMSQTFYIYSILITTFTTITFFALQGWRSFVYREAYIEQLRPFVRGQHITQNIFMGDAHSTSRAKELFRTICEEILDTQHAQLIPMGVLAPLAGNPLIYPESDSLVAFDAQKISTATASVIELPADANSPLRWAIPLWAERGVIGILLIGERKNKGLYAQEEMEIARATAERIIDMLAGEEMVRRLMQVQRRRRIETRVMDLQTRRILHDDILPALHMAVLEVSALAAERTAIQAVIASLTDVHKQISTLIHAPELTASTQSAEAEHWEDHLQQSIDSDFADKFDSITWAIDDHVPPIDDVGAELLFAAVREAVRNAAVHGRGSDQKRPLNLHISILQRDGVTILVDDDGVGLKFSRPTSEPPSGSGGGLILHSTMLSIVGGHLTSLERPEGGTRVVLSLPQLEPSVSSE